MSIIDVRGGFVQTVEEIRFADKLSARGYVQSYKLVTNEDFGNSVVIADDEYEGFTLDKGAVLVIGKEHGENLIKAIQKAIELEWLQ